MKRKEKTWFVETPVGFVMGTSKSLQPEALANECLQEAAFARKAARAALAHARECDEALCELTDLHPGHPLFAERFNGWMTAISYFESVKAFEEAALAFKRGAHPSSDRV